VSDQRTSLCQVDLDVGLIGSVVTGSGSDLSEESVVGVEPAALDCRVAPWCPPGPVSSLGCASRKGGVNGIGELSFQAAQGFPVAFSGCALALVVGAAGGVVADLGDGHDVPA
jgi:hypothetical protein